MQSADRQRLVMLVDDNPADLFFNERLIKLVHPETTIVSFNKAAEAMEYLNLIAASSEKIFPDYIFLDLNMPRYNGFDFLKEYQDITGDLKPKSEVILLTCSLNPYDRMQLLMFSSIKEFVQKPLSVNSIRNLFPN
jgi:response regulator RpfG family c-di-GMP phosphodiesterase